MHERVLEGSILLSEVTSLTRARRLYDVFEKNWNYLLRLHLTRAWRVPVISGYRAKIKGAPRDRVPLSLMTSLGSLDKNGRKSSGDVSAHC